MYDAGGEVLTANPFFFFFQAEDGIRDDLVTGVQTCALPILSLPFDPKAKDVDILLMVDRKYAGRIRTDSRARLKKLGLLAGDSYVDISPGNPRFDELEPGAQIPSARQPNRDQLISSVEDLVRNLVQISYSLENF